MRGYSSDGGVKSAGRNTGFRPADIFRGKTFQRGGRGSHKSDEGETGFRAWPGIALPSLVSLAAAFFITIIRGIVIAPASPGR